MTTATLEREELQHIIQSMPDERISAVLMFVKDFYTGEHIPNEETKAAMREADELARIYSSHLESTV